MRKCHDCGALDRRKIRTMGSYSGWACTNEECERWSDIPGPATASSSGQQTLTDYSEAKA